MFCNLVFIRGAMNFCLHFQIAAIRAFGGDDIKSVTRRAWKETMADSLMSQFTWTGQLKKGSTKKMGLSLEKSNLAKTVFGKFVLVT
jgi:hypothetical protein